MNVPWISRAHRSSQSSRRSEASWKGIKDGRVLSRIDSLLEPACAFKAMNSKNRKRTSRRHSLQEFNPKPNQFHFNIKVLMFTFRSFKVFLQQSGERLTARLYDCNSTGLVAREVKTKWYSNLSFEKLAKFCFRGREGERFFYKFVHYWINRQDQVANDHENDSNSNK